MVSIELSAGIHAFTAEECAEMMQAVEAQMERYREMGADIEESTIIGVYAWLEKSINKDRIQEAIHEGILDGTLQIAVDPEVLDNPEGPHEKDISIGVSKDSGYDDLMSFVIDFFIGKYGEENVQVDFG